jgi:hypothetical protein
MKSLVEDHVKIDIALRHVVNRLFDEYGDRCSREHVEAAVDEARAVLMPANVEVFVAVLIERAAREQLDAQFGRAVR